MKPFLNFFFGLFLFVLFESCSTFGGPDVSHIKYPEVIRVKIASTGTGFTLYSEDGLSLKINGKDSEFSGKEFIYKTSSYSSGTSVFVKSYGSSIHLNSTPYRGNFEIIQKSMGAIAINHVPLEEYLKSVVPSEMPASWHSEALKAQAISARTYAIFNIFNKRTPEYDLDSGTNSQVYKGIKSEDARSSRAVTETEKIIMVYDSKPIQAFFHSHSGGVTEDPEYVWGTKTGYLESVDSEFCDQAFPYTWDYSFTGAIITNKLSMLGLGEISEMVVDKTFPSGRVSKIKVTGSNGEASIDGSDFRSLFGGSKIKSLLFEIEQKEGIFLVKGKGFGHGVGLSQYGANGMAKADYSYDDILKHYYRDIDIVEIE